MIDEFVHRQVCDALHRAIAGRDQAIAQRDVLLEACKMAASVAADLGMDELLELLELLDAAIDATEKEVSK